MKNIYCKYNTQKKTENSETEINNHNPNTL